jgi:hypothetical protein
MRFIDDVLRCLPFRVHVVQTDNGAEFQPQCHWHWESRDMKCVDIRPRTPRLNGKGERSHRVDDQEFYQLLDREAITDDIHLSTTSCASGRTTTITTAHTARWTARPRTNGSVARTKTGVSPKV